MQVSDLTVPGKESSLADEQSQQPTVADSYQTAESKVDFTSHVDTLYAVKHYVELHS